MNINQLKSNLAQWHILVLDPMIVINFVVSIATNHKLVNYKFTDKKFLFLFMVNFDINYLNIQK